MEEEEIEVTAEQEEVNETVREFQIALQQLAIDFGLVGIVAIYASSEDGLLQATQVGQHTDKMVDMFVKYKVDNDESNKGI